MLRRKAFSLLSLLMLSVLSFALLVSALGVVYSKHLYRKLHIELQHLQQTRDLLHNEWTQLLLEQGTLASDVRVERIARDALSMKFPNEQIEVIRP